MKKIDKVLKLVCKRYKVDVTDLIGDRRLKGLVEARHVAMWLARATTDMTLNAIGERFENRHHSTIIHAIDSITDKMRVDPQLYETVDGLRIALTGEARGA